MIEKGVEGVKRKELRLRLKELDNEDCYAIWLEVICLWARSQLRWIFLRDGQFNLIRMMVIYAIVLPLSLWIYTPTVCEPHWDLVGVWFWSVMAMVGLNKVLPI